ncbi:MAG TPA: bifunctional demethylmenaquinone methyltransferase/2-methoxy-6-polyprenyl-1,4-benzoquinol methylase UbiE [Rhodospirillaceae bacterium]|nr:MAG: bifunctional demethylmenaquinone methyltransferase/2-methoxy-6-polyprenyl-1,4-benzoquinol methylase [Alphaproteobacteria bacterium GWF2_58_20]HAU29476.1 bifunctional demethylmenaquinone methyltransferase/2-methoxy-6-polyprenyl-1,4-benzoquinol methylase UbiE [Rhodospirillaceae bacterium]
MKNPEGNWFGNQPTTPEEKTRRVGRVFEDVAPHYDLMNDLMSLGLHRLWKAAFVRKIHPRAGEAILDLAGGTGDIAFRLADAGANVTVCDINPAMLEEGQKRQLDKGRMMAPISWVEGNAECLPFDAQTFDAASIAFGLRNVSRMDDALAEIHRTLKPGGRFACLEFSMPEHPLLKTAYDLYSADIIPALGEAVAQDREAYAYLVESIRKFPDAKNLARRMEKAGFGTVHHETLMGGICAIHTGWRR